MGISQDVLLAAVTREMERIAKQTENWLERMKALGEIGKQFEALEPSAVSALNPEIWKVLKPLKAVVQDLRSQIVKEVCNLLATIAKITRDVMVPFVREMLPSLLEVRGSGNKVCGAYCGECIDALISFTVVKGATLKLFVDMQVETKNKLIRLSCISALKLSVVNWSSVLDKTDVQQLERGLKSALEDPSSSCRSVAYELFAVFQLKFPKRAAVVTSLVDYKIQKRLESMVATATGDPAATPTRRPTPSIADSTDDNTGGIDSARSGLSYDVGDRVCIPDKELFGFVRFIGDIEGVKGMWVGIELDEPLGKNDGSVKGKYYFRCKPKHGVFARPHQVFLTITGDKLAAQGSKGDAALLNKLDSTRTMDESFSEIGPPSEDGVESALNIELGSLQLTPGAAAAAAASAMGSAGDVPEPSALHTVLFKASAAHRKYLVRLLQLVQAELLDHQQFDTYMSTASSADAVQYLQQLQNSAQDKIVLSDVFIQHMIQAQQAARES
jgi:hypothetical protein